VDPGAAAGFQTLDAGFGYSWRLTLLSCAREERGESQAWSDTARERRWLGTDDVLTSASRDVQPWFQRSRAGAALTTETRASIRYLVFRCGVNPAGVSTFLGAPTPIPEDGESSWGSGTSSRGEEITSQKGFQIGH